MKKKIIIVLVLFVAALIGIWKLNSMQAHKMLVQNNMTQVEDLEELPPDIKSFLSSQDDILGARVVSENEILVMKKPIS